MKRFLRFLKLSLAILIGAFLSWAIGFYIFVFLLIYVYPIQAPPPNWLGPVSNLAVPVFIIFGAYAGGALFYRFEKKKK